MTFWGFGSDSGCLMCLSLRLLNTIRPSLMKKINRLPTPVAALVSVSTYLFIQPCAYHSCLSIFDFFFILFWKGSPLKTI